MLDPPDDPATPEDLAAAENFPYRTVIGACLHAACWVLPDIAVALSQLARHSNSPRREHIARAKDMVRYMFHRRHLGLTYVRGGPEGMYAYCDADYAESDNVSRRSTSGFAVMRCVTSHSPHLLQRYS